MSSGFPNTKHQRSFDRVSRRSGVSRCLPSRARRALIEFRSMRPPSRAARDGSGGDSGPSWSSICQGFRAGEGVVGTVRARQDRQLGPLKSPICLGVSDQRQLTLAVLNAYLELPRHAPPPGQLPHVIP